MLSTAKIHGAATFKNQFLLTTIFVVLVSWADGATADGPAFGSSGTNVSIPDGGNWVSSRITIDDAPNGAVVTGIDVYFRCAHPYSGDLNIDLNADPQGNLGNVDLWRREGGAADNPARTVTGITTFNGLSANRTWYLYARDEESLDSGYIDEWWILVYYEIEQEPPVAPSLVSPGSASSPGEEISDLTPTMKWSSSSGATGYGLYVSRNDSGSWTLIFDSETEYGGPISGTSRTLPSGIVEAGEAYRWNMRAYNDAGWGNFSNRFYFTTRDDGGGGGGGGGGGVGGATFQWPVDNHEPTQGYAQEAAAGHHTGLDLISSTGSTVIRAAAAGTARVVPESTYINNNHYMGNVIVIDHNAGKGPYTLYAHLDAFSISDGQNVVAGQQIGVMGSTGCSGCGIHLHFEAKHWDVLGSLDDDLGPDWGYSDGHPNLHGYINPWPYLETEVPFVAPQPVMSLLSQSVLTGPDPTDYTTVVTRVDSGQMFSAFGEYSGWYQVFLAGQNGPVSGWIQASPVSAEQKPVSDPVRGLQGVSVRLHPTSTSTRLGYVWDEQWLVTQDESAPGGGCSEKWFRIDSGENLGTGGWVCGEYLGAGGGGELPLFVDGFESGNTFAWTQTVTP